MKKKISLIVIIVLLGMIIFIKPKNTFKKEYESLNGKTNDNGKTYLNVNISKDNPVEYADYKKVFEVLDKSGIIYFGFSECPWCRNAVPVLLDAAKETGVEKIYYMNNLNDRDIKKLENNEIVTEKEGTKNYKKLLKKLGDKASVYEGLNDDNIKRLYFPTVVVVKNGKITDYIVGTVDAQKDPYKKLTKSQKKELKEKYVKAMSATLTCSLNAEEKC